VIIRETPKFYVVRIPRYQVWEGNSGKEGTADVYYRKDEWHSFARFHGWNDGKPSDLVDHDGLIQVPLGMILFSGLAPSRVKWV
jgi:hypothetical protein